MSDQPETLAAILAEMRLDADILVFPTLTPDKLRTYADRIERAAERERNAHTNDIHDALYKATGIPGNAAAMREALEQALAYCESDQKSGIAYSDNDVLVPMLRAALAAPARNCDRFKTLDEAREAFQDLRGHKILADVELWDSMDEAGALVRWLFAPAEGGDHA